MSFIIRGLRIYTEGTNGVGKKSYLPPSKSKIAHDYKILFFTLGPDLSADMY